MPIFGTGIMPPSGNVASELESVTRRGFVPKVVVQIYQATPFLQRMLDRANVATGGISPITVPVQGQSMVNMEWSGYSGAFNQPATLTGLQNAEFNLKLGLVPIPFLGMEGLVQLNHAVISLIEARVNDAISVLRQGLATALISNFSNSQQPVGLVGAIDDGTVMNVYGGISRAADPWWKSLAINAGNVDPTRDLISQYINTLVKRTGEQPTMGLMSFGTWQKMLTTLMPIERIYNVPAESKEHISICFRSVDISGVPIYPDPFIPDGFLYLLNEKYIGPYIHVNGSFNFSGFYSTIPNMSIGFLGVLLVILELVNVKPNTCAKIYNLNYVSM